MGKKSHYNAKKDQNEPVWFPYINRETGIYTTSGGLLAMGVMRKPNFHTKFISFIPSLAFKADDEHAYLESKIPMRMPLQMFERGEAYFRPLKEGYLEERVQVINRLGDKKKGIVGFAKPFNGKDAKK